MPKRLKASLCIDDYDCIGFDLDHTLCRYNVGNVAKLVYELLANYLIEKKGYDRAIRTKSFSDDIHLLCKGLTLDCERGNILRLGPDGVVLGKFFNRELCSMFLKEVLLFSLFLLLLNQVQKILLQKIVSNKICNEQNL